MADVDIEKTKADELLAQSIKTIQDKVDSMEENLNKSNEDVLKVSEFKTFSERVTDDIEKLDVSIKNSQVPAMSDEEIEKKEYANFNNTLKYAGMRSASGEKFHNMEAFKPESEEKAMQVNNDVRAGYLQTPPEFINEIIDQAAHDFAPMRRVSRVMTTVSNRIQIPAKSARGAASWVAEAGTTSEDTTLTFGLEDIPLHKATALYKATIEMIDDAAFNLQAELRNEYSEGFGVLSGTGYTTGTGIGQPEGVMTHGSISSTNSGNVSAITADGFIRTLFAQKDAYSMNLYWMMKRATLGVAAAFKGGDGQYLLSRLGDSPTFFIQGIEVLQNPDMPAIAADAYPVILGDFKHYIIVDKVVSQLQIVDPYTSKATGIVEFLLNWRTGGQVTNAEAFRKMKVSA